MHKSGMYHACNNLFFGRMADGGVRVLKFAFPPGEWPRADAPPYAGAQVDVALPASMWASVLATVSERDESTENYQRAEAFHAGREY